MPRSENASAPLSPQPAVEALLKTIDEEGEAVRRLDGALARQLEALQTNRRDALADATDEASRAAGDLHRLHAVRERRTGLLARLLGPDTDLDPTDSASIVDALAALHPSLAERLQAAQEALRARVRTTRARSEELAFALHVAAHVGREMLLAWQHLDAPTQIYTAGGTGSDAAPPRPFVNRLG